MTTTDYYFRTDDDDAPMYLIRVTDAGAAVEVWNRQDQAWVPVDSPADTLALVEPGADPDYRQVPAVEAARFLRHAPGSKVT